MHYQMLVTLTLTEGDTSLDARRKAEEILQNDASFCGDGGRFGSPAVQRVRHRRSLERAFFRKPCLATATKPPSRRNFPEMATGWVSSSVVETHP